MKTIILALTLILSTAKNLKSTTPVNVPVVSQEIANKPAVFETPSITHFPKFIPFTRKGLPSRNLPGAIVSFTASNSDNLNTFGNLVRSPELVGPQTIFHTNAPVSSVISTQAVVGHRHEQTQLEVMNLRNGQVENHVINQKQPIIGNIQQPFEGVAHHSTRLDLVTNELYQQSPSGFTASKET